MNTPELRPIQVQLLHVPGCPLLDQVRQTLTESVRHASIPISVEEVEGAYPSPTVVVNGMDVMTGAPPAPDDAYCRLDLPTSGQILAALAAARRRRK